MRKNAPTFTAAMDAAIRDICKKPILEEHLLGRKCTYKHILGNLFLLNFKPIAPNSAELENFALTDSIKSIGASVVVDGSAPKDSISSLLAIISDNSNDNYQYTYTVNIKRVIIRVWPKSGISVDRLQDIIDEYLKEQGVKGYKFIYGYIVGYDYRGIPNHIQVCFDDLGDKKYLTFPVYARHLKDGMFEKNYWFKPNHTTSYIDFIEEYNVEHLDFNVDVFKHFYMRIATALQFRFIRELTYIENYFRTNKLEEAKG